MYPRSALNAVICGLSFDILQGLFFYPHLLISSSYFIFFGSGMNKMVINHLDKLFVTNDAATIVNELEVQHPAAKILVLAGKAQQEEIGDGANLTISFAGELLQNAEELIRMGLHPSEIISGYTKAINKVCSYFTASLNDVFL